MYENSLVKYYREKAREDGVLDTRDIPLKLKRYCGVRLSLCSLPEGTFYKKLTGYNIYAKRVTDAEVLLSQIYNRAGISSSIYLPATEDGNSYVLSNNIKTNTTRLAFKQINRLIKPDEEFPTEFLSSSYMAKSALEYYSEGAIADQIKMRVLDVASFIQGRHTKNFFYTVNNDKIDGVSCIDFEASGIKFQMGATGEEEYFNEFLMVPLTRQEFLEEFKDKETVTDFINPTELAEEIGSLDPHLVALDIKGNIGYQVDPKFTDFLANSYDNMAESLIQ